jgi:protocatechuate 3,4-dioxygenase beta subunit
MAAALLTGGLLVAGVNLLGAVPAAAAGTTWYAYPSGTSTSPTSCPETATTGSECSLTQALSDAAPGDTVALATSGDEGNSATWYVGNFTVSSGTSTSPLAIEAAPGVTDPILDGNLGSATDCPTTACDGPVLSIGSGVYATIEGITIQRGYNSTSNYGGGVYNDGTATLTDDTFSTDWAGLYGGGVYDGVGSTSTLTDDTFSGDSAAFGGGISINNPGTATLTDDTFSGDWATSSYGDGGGVFNLGTATLTDDTFSGDSATLGVGDGGGVYNDGTATLTDDTFSTDSATYGGGVYNYSDSSATISDSILDAAPCYGTITDGEYNVESDNTCDFVTNDLVSNTDINLASSLAANGSSGPETLAIGTLSSAYKEVPAAKCTVSTDERGDPRPGVPNQNCDAGAFEYQAPAITSAGSTTFTVGDSGSFTVTTSTGDGGTPSLIETGTLPSGVSFVDSGNGSASLSGTPASDTAGSYSITITAQDTNDVSTTQDFTLTVVEPVTVNVSGTQTYGGSATFTYTTAPSGVTVSSLTCTEVGSATPINSSLAAGSYTVLGSSCSAGANADYSFSFTGVSGGFVVGQEAQTITMATTGTTTFEPSSPYNVGATTNDTDPAATLVYTVGASSTATDCSVDASGNVSWTSTGTCVIDVNSAATTNFSVASQAQQTVSVAGATTGWISGSVTAAGAGPLGGICVNANGIDSTVGSGSAITAADGTYTIKGLAPGSYDVEFYPSGCGNDYVTQFWNNQPGPGSANAVLVTVGSTVPGINAAMVGTGAISGIVTDLNGTDLPDICVTAIRTGISRRTISATDGTYTITGVIPGSYDVEFSNGCGNSGDYANQWWDEEPEPDSAVPVSVAAESTVPGINAAMVDGGEISGTVVLNAFGGYGLAYICVTASGTDGTLGFGSAITAGDGTYAITGLTPGSYVVEFSNGCGNSGDYVTQYDNAGPVTDQGNYNTLGDSGETIMVEGGEIAGNVTAASDSSDLLQGICVTATGTGGSGSATTASNGYYQISGLLPGSYDVEFSTGCGNLGDYATQYVDGVSVTPEGIHYPIDAAMVIGASVTVPGAPSNVTASAGVSSATVSWTDPASNGGATISSYTVTASGGGGQSCTVSGATATSCTVSGLSNGTTYTFTVTATNSVGTSSASSPSNSVIPEPATEPPPVVPARATVAPAPARVVAAVPQIVVESTRVVLTGTRIPVKLSCGGARCSGTVTMTESVKVKVKKGKKTVTKTETLLLASSSYTLAKGASTTVDLVRTSRGKGVLKKAKPTSPLHETLVATAAGGATVRKIVAVT